MAAHTFSIGFKSGDNDGHGNTANSYWRNSYVTLAWCRGTLSCASVSHPPDSVNCSALVPWEYLWHKYHQWPSHRESNEQSFYVSNNPTPNIRWPMTPVFFFKNHFRFEPLIFLPVTSYFVVTNIDVEIQGTISMSNDT